MPLKFDIEKARDFTRNHIRTIRIAVLERLDVAFIRMLEGNDVVLRQSIIDMKQGLRDMPADPRIGAAETQTELDRVLAIHIEKINSIQL